MSGASIYAKYEALLAHLKTLTPSKARDNAIQRLEEASFWTSAAIVGTDSPIEYTSDKPARKVMGPKTS